MREIRTVEPHEAEDFLRLLCSVFNLEFDRARGIFFTEPLFDLRRKWALFEGGKPVSILTTVPLEFGWGLAIGIAGVATRSDRRGEGLAGTLMAEVLREASTRDERAALLFARDERIYAKHGFQTLDSVVYAGLRPGTGIGTGEPLDFQQTRERYDAWSTASQNRLRRSDARWAYWRWNLRTCWGIPSGYVCVEGAVVRECVSDGQDSLWPVGEGCDWFGLLSMAHGISAPIEATRHEMHLMGRGLSKVPEMFMTDQF